MHDPMNANTRPLHAETPFAPEARVRGVETTPRGLIRATIGSLAAATAILTLFWLPAEYGIDPTGLGRVTGLTQMGEIKQQLYAEAAAEDAAEAALPATPPAPAPAARREPVHVEPYVLAMDELQRIAEGAGLSWVNSDADKIREAQAAIAAEPKPVHVPRERKPLDVVDEGPLVLVETRKDLSQIKLPFDTTA